MSAGNEVKVTISGNDSKLIATWQQQNAEILKNQQSLIKMGQAGEQAGNKVGGSMDKATGSAIQFATAVTGVGSVIGGAMVLVNQLKTEYADLLNKQKQAADRQVSTAEAERKALINKGTSDTLSDDRYKQRIAEISKSTGVVQKDLHLAASSAFSARGQLSHEKALEAVELAAKLSPGDSAGIETVSGALLDMQKKGGGSAKQNLGLMVALQGASRVKNLDALARNVVPGSVAMQSFGDSPEESAEVLAAMTQALSDFEGAISKTAAVQLASQLKEALPKLPSTTARIKFLHSDEGAKLRKKLLDPRSKTKLQGEAIALPAMQNLITPGTAEAAQLKTAQESILSLDESEAASNELFERLRVSPLQNQADQKRFWEADTDSKQLEDLASGSKAIVRQGLDSALRQRGRSVFDRWGTEAEFDFRTEMLGQDPNETALKFLKGEENTERMRASKGPNVSPEHMRRADEYKELAARLAELIDVTKANGDKTLKVEADVPIRPKLGPASAHDRGALEK